MSAQAFQALQIANERRSAMRDVRLTIEQASFVSGCELVAQMLRDPTEHQATMPLGRLLLAIDRFGAQSLGPALRAAGIITADRRVRQLTNRQREALALHLEIRASRHRPRSAAA